MWMAHSTKFLRPIRQSITVITSSYPPIFHSRKSYYAKFEPLKTLIKALEPVLRNRVSAFERQLIPWRKYFCFSGCLLDYLEELWLQGDFDFLASSLNSKHGLLDGLELQTAAPICKQQCQFFPEFGRARRTLGITSDCASVLPNAVCRAGDEGSPSKSVLSGLGTSYFLPPLAQKLTHK
ncbi:uncharacterized protein LOC108984725 isoform X2 [Juglans regia]|uniref:Uncharacterized protein LOC108984725 isoform X2 n=1 Tax=Juglans regia TaxID=51240 RepID=A0A6P9EPI9_JUGRE|nr:uncharacterized protein LOC108984725 isoform X2 [Juglans regia]XP_035550590.1 uncharacterized protein LOC108984725 isoform X2 [Juglans regia]